MTHPFVMSIAGFDPSGGAGLLADIKTFEANKTQGLGVITANTFQNENEFDGLAWVSLETIRQQLEVLSRKYKPDFVKVGLIESLETMEALTDHLKTMNKDVKIIWDPILKASAGHAFHALPEAGLFESICKKIHLVTPNWDEMKVLYPDSEPLESATRLSHQCIVYLKGGHREEHKGKDYLLEGKRQFAFNPSRLAPYDKHGTGCVFSAALTAQLARNFPLKKAALRAKTYVTKYLLSNKTRLGYHKM